MTIGQRIRIRREELGMSQTELAQKLGFKNRSSLNKIEMDINAPRQKIIKALADALETDVLYILGISEETERKEKELCELFADCYGKESYQIVSDFLKLDTNDRSAVAAMIKSLLSTDKYKKGITA